MGPAIWTLLMLCLMPVFVWSIRVKRGKYLYIAPWVFMLIGLVLLAVVGKLTR